MKRTLLVAALLAASSSASALPFYIDIGNNYSGGNDKVCPTCTSMKNEFLFTYESESLITDTDGSGTVTNGDEITTNAGYGVLLSNPGNPGSGLVGDGSLGENQLTGFTPNESFGSYANNGYGQDWMITFNIYQWEGTVTVDPLTNNIYPTYGAGLLELFVTFDGVTFNNFMDINMTQGYVTGLGSVLEGTVDFTNVDAGFNNLFHSSNYACNGSDGFYDIWLNCGAGAGNDSAIRLVDTSFDSNVTIANAMPVVTPNGVAFSLSTDHDGSGTFAVPEPGTLSLLGLSLLGLGGLRMRKKAA